MVDLAAEKKAKKERERAYKARIAKEKNQLKVGIDKKDISSGKKRLLVIFGIMLVACAFIFYNMPS